MYLKVYEDNLLKNLEKGDWVWFHNLATNEKMMASQFQTLSKKFALIFKNLGIGFDDKVYF